MTTRRVVEDLPVIEKAAVTLSLEELELDSEASKKKWNRSYGEARVTANRAAAFTGTTRKGKGRGLFDEDDNVNDENDEGYLRTEEGAAWSDPTGEVSITLLDEDLLTVDDDELLPFTTSYSSNASTNVKKAASKARSHVPLFGDVGKDDDHSGLFGKTPITAGKYSALFAGEDVVDSCDDSVNKTVSIQQPAALSGDNSKEDRAHDLYGKKSERQNQSADMIGNVGPGDFFGKPATISEASSKERCSILFDNEGNAEDLASPFGTKVSNNLGAKGLFDDVVGAQEVGGLFGKKPEVAGTHERCKGPSILIDGKDTEKTVRSMPDTSASEVLGSVGESDKKADFCSDAAFPLTTGQEEQEVSPAVVQET